MLIAESFGIVASVLGFCLSLYLLWQGHFGPTVFEQKKLVIILIIAAVVSGVALSYLAFRIKIRINTKIQEDIISFDHKGDADIYYPLPFKQIPYLKIEQVGNSFFSPGPYVKEQSRYGFKIWVPGEGSFIRWRAEGIILNGMS